MRRIFEFIDIYPDVSTFSIILIAIAVQMLIGNKIDAILLSISLMLPTLLVTLPANVFMKMAFKVRRPKRYYETVKGRDVFEGSFPSFHAQFSAGEATAFIMGIYLFSPKSIRLVATLLAILIVGISSIIIAISRVALGMHHLIDAVGGVAFGILFSLCSVYSVAGFWEYIPPIDHLAMIATFVIIVFSLSERQRWLRQKDISG